MTAEDINPAIGIKPLKFPLRDTPHLTIEPNRTCNIRCRTCYNLYRDHVKPIQEVKKEIDQALQKRNLAIITLLGGEPTLHPCLPDIISYIKSKNLYCQLLTNGLTLLRDKRGEFLNGLIASGLDKILVHIDIGQSHVHHDIEDSRRAVFSELEKKKIPFSLALTVYNEERGLIPDLVKKYSGYRFFDGVLAVLARDPLPPKIQNVELSEEYDSLARKLVLEPVAYIPSSLDDGHVHWLIYFYFMNAKTGAAFGPSPLLYRIFRRFFRWIRRRQSFALTISPLHARWLSLVAGLGEVLCHPWKTRAFIQFLCHSDLLRSMRFHYIAIQKPPEFNPKVNQYQLCYHCPDATIRNGKLTPVCLADWINPLDGDSRAVDKDLYQTVYAHLQEI